VGAECDHVLPVVQAGVFGRGYGFAEAAARFVVWLFEGEQEEAARREHALQDGQQLRQLARLGGGEDQAGAARRVASQLPLAAVTVEDGGCFAEQPGELCGVAFEDGGAAGCALVAGVADVRGRERGQARVGFDSDRAAAVADRLDQDAAGTAGRVDDEIAGVGVSEDRAGGELGCDPVLAVAGGEVAVWEVGVAGRPDGEGEMGWCGRFGRMGGAGGGAGQPRSGCTLRSSGDRA